MERRNSSVRDKRDAKIAEIIGLVRLLLESEVDVGLGCFGIKAVNFRKFPIAIIDESLPASTTAANAPDHSVKLVDDISRLSKDLSDIKQSITRQTTDSAHVDMQNELVQLKEKFVRFEDKIGAINLNNVENNAASSNNISDSARSVNIVLFGLPEKRHDSLPK